MLEDPRRIDDMALVRAEGLIDRLRVGYVDEETWRGRGILKTNDVEEIVG